MGKTQIPFGAVIIEFTDDSGQKTSVFHSTGRHILDLLNKGIKYKEEKNGYTTFGISEDGESVIGQVYHPPEIQD